MTNNLVLFILLAGMAFVAGAAVALIVSERSLSARHRRQALRERELAEFSAFVNDRLGTVDIHSRPTIPPRTMTQGGGPASSLIGRPRSRSSGGSG